MQKIIDCITFFKENFVTDLRLQILKHCVDKFIICESIYDHKGNKKKINFKITDASISDKIKHIIIDQPFPNPEDPWLCQKYQRDYILNFLDDYDSEDYVMFSDPDEIPSPDLLANFSLKKKFGIFLQKHFVYKFNILNQYENPWAGTRVCKKKNLISLDDLKHKILLKNIKKWWRPDKQKSIELFENGGWHFNNFFSPDDLSLKLKTFAHSEYDDPQYTNQEIIKKKISMYEDLYGRGWKFSKIQNDNDLPKYIIDNKQSFKDFFET